MNSLTKIAAFLYNLFVTAASPALKIATFVIPFIAYTNTLWDGLFARIDGLVQVATGNADFSPLGLINYCFPLNVLLDYVIAYAALRTTCAAIRIIKSFVPSVA